MRILIAMVLCVSIASPAIADWKMEQRVNEMDKTTSFLIYTRAEKPIKDQLGRATYLLLTIICIPSNTGTDPYFIAVTFDSPAVLFLFGNIQVRYRVDDSAITDTQWDATGGSSSIFAPDPPSRELIEALIAGERLHFQIYPPHGVSRYTTFSLAGFTAAYQKMENVCLGE